MPCEKSVNDFARQRRFVNDTSILCATSWGVQVALTSLR